MLYQPVEKTEGVKQQSGLMLCGGVCRNKLDLVIVVLALADIFTSSDKVSSLSSVFRIFRVVRLAKVLQQVK